MTLWTEGMCHIGGEKPTRADPDSRAEAGGSSVAGDWPWGGTRDALRGVFAKWSVVGELLRSRMVADQVGAPVHSSRVAWGCGDFSRSSPPGCSWIGPADTERAYRGREARWQPAITAGTLTSSASGVLGVVRDRYKQTRNPVFMRRRGGWSSPSPWRTQHLSVKAQPTAPRSAECPRWPQADDRRE
jgi:hypothetical protein